MVRHVYRELLKAVRSHAKGDHFAGFISQEFRNNTALKDPTDVRHKLDLAKDYSFLVRSVHAHKELLISYNISVDRDVEHSVRLKNTAERVGLSMPELYEPDELPKIAMRNVKRTKHGPILDQYPEVDSGEESEVEELELEGNEDFEGITEEVEGDLEAFKYIEEFKVEVIEDLRSCEMDGLQIARDMSAGAPERFVEWVISPMQLERFQTEFWEKRPFFIRRPKHRGFYNGFFGKADIEKLLETHQLKYGLNIDVTKYEDNARSTFSSEANAKPAKVWSKYAKGWSVRILHPQRWCDPIFLFLSAFERHWGSVAGCNAYLTPPGSQGFSPHFDDIEAFVIQTEGKKRWKLYGPRTAPEVLPRFSSPNFEEGEIGEPILDVELEAGDLLYMPRGTIHQAKAAPNTHSLHITVSVGQRNCWADFLELAVPRALQLASEDHLLLRETLPRGYADYMGVSHSDEHDNPQRAAFIEKILECMNLVSQSIPWDSAADQLAVKFLQSRLPLPSHSHDAASSKASLTKATQKQNIAGNSKVALVAPGIARLVVEEESAVVYHMLSNSRDLHNEGDVDSPLEEEPSSQGRLAFSLDLAPALEELVVAYPEAVTVSSLPVPKDQAVNLVSELCGCGLLVVAS